MIRSVTALTAATVLALCATTGAEARDADATRSTRVNYADLDLAHDAGVNALYARLRSAAGHVCASPNFRDVIDQACASRALDEAVANVANEQLSALHTRQAGAERPAG
ncbi:MAG: UrcA family protein [Proteobacteria bacterium]|nr:UrcA family protein [Pseudomonadota bacterium]